MAEVKAPKGFEIAGPWMKRYGDWYRVPSVAFSLCADGLIATLGLKTWPQEIRLTLTANKPKHEAVCIQLESGIIILSWREAGTEPWGVFTRDTSEFLSRQLPKMNEGDTITLWLSVETR